MATFERAASEAVAVTEVLTAEMSYSRTISDVVFVVDAIAAEDITLDVFISDTVEVADQLTTSTEAAKPLSDFVNVTDQLQAELTLGAYMADVIAITDAIAGQLIQGATESIEVVDQLLIEASYSRIANDVVEYEDRILEGDPTLVVHSIDGGANTGPAGIFAVSPTGPLSISGTPDCVTSPIGFVVQLADHVECTDRILASLTCEVVINDSAEVVD